MKKLTGNGIRDDLQKGLIDAYFKPEKSNKEIIRKALLVLKDFALKLKIEGDMKARNIWNKNSSAMINQRKEEKEKKKNKKKNKKEDEKKLKLDEKEKKNKLLKEEREKRIAVIKEENRRINMQKK